MDDTYHVLMRQKAAKGVAFSREEARALEEAKGSEVTRRLYDIRRARQDKAVRAFKNAVIESLGLKIFFSS